MVAKKQFSNNLMMSLFISIGSHAPDDLFIKPRPKSLSILKAKLYWGLRS